MGYFESGMGENRNMNGGNSWQPCTTFVKTPAEIAWPAEWLRIRQLLLRATAPFPEARAAIAEALRAQSDEEEPGS